MRLLGENSAKAFMVATQIPSEEEAIAEYRRLWEMAKVSLPDEAVTYDVANQLGARLQEKGKHEEAKALYLAALEGKRRVLAEEHRETLNSLNYMGLVLSAMEDYGGALDYHQQTLSVQEKVLGKTRPYTLITIEGMACAYQVGLKEFIKAEEMYRLTLDGREK